MIGQVRNMRRLVVIGAGPAGVAASIAAVRAGAAVTLIDKATFPRDKVCGCCLNESGLAVLRELGVADAAAGRSLERFCVATGGRAAEVRLHHGVAISRRRMDTALIERAVGEGVTFISGTKAKVIGPGHVSAGDRQIDADLVICADGLKGQAAERDDAVHPAARIGIGTTVDSGGNYEPGTIYMVCGRGGYVGLVRVEDGLLNVAGAFDAAFVRESGGPGGAVDLTIGDAGLPPIDWPGDTHWQGTPALTRRRRAVVGDRLLIVGDSAGYVEPFTGEGMAWALAGGAAAGALAANGWQTDTAARWEAMHRQIVRRRQGVCRMVAGLLRRPRLTGLAVDVLRFGPGVARVVSRRLNRPPRPIVLNWQNGGVG